MMLLVLSAKQANSSSGVSAAGLAGVAGFGGACFLARFGGAFCRCGWTAARLGGFDAAGLVPWNPG